MMLGCAWVCLQKHQSAKGGGTLKVCWSCVDLSRPLETQTVDISPGNMQLILFSLLQCFLVCFLWKTCFR